MLEVIVEGLWAVARAIGSFLTSGPWLWVALLILAVILIVEFA